MSAQQEYNSACDLLVEIFTATRDVASLSHSEVYRLKNNFKNHIENMIRSQIGNRNMGERIYLRFGCDTSSAKEHYDYAAQALSDLYALIHGLDPLDHEIKFLQAKIVRHMECIIDIHTRGHEDDYYNQMSYSNMFTI